MPKKIIKTKKQKTNKHLSLKQKIAGLSLAKKIVILICVIAAGLFAWYQLQIYQERTMYNRAERQMEEFMYQVAKLGSGEKEKRNYCSYTSEKSGKGNLGCTVFMSYKYHIDINSEESRILLKIDALQRRLEWQLLGENTEGNKKYISKDYLKSLIYQADTLRCGIRYIHAQERGLVVESSCSGSALKEYY
jgi:hypothetical protein